MIIVYMTFMSVFRKMQIFYCYYLYALELYTVIMLISIKMLMNMHIKMVLWMNNCCNEF